MRPIFASAGVVACLFFFTFAPSAQAKRVTTLPQTHIPPFQSAGAANDICSPAHAHAMCRTGVRFTLPTPTPQPTISPHSFQELSDLNTASEDSVSKPVSLDAEKIMRMIQDHRASLGLPAYETDEQLCRLAADRGPELYDEIFKTGDIHGGLYRRNIPFWITENMKYGESEASVFAWWLSSPIHRKAIEGSFRYSCGVCWGNSCAQLFTSYVPK